MSAARPIWVSALKCMHCVWVSAHTDTAKVCASSKPEAGHIFSQASSQVIAAV